MGFPKPNMLCMLHLFQYRECGSQFPSYLRDLDLSKAGAGRSCNRDAYLPLLYALVHLGDPKKEKEIQGLFYLE
jgi:hypothetical protein